MVMPEEHGTGDQKWVYFMDTCIQLSSGILAGQRVEVQTSVGPSHMSRRWVAMIPTHVPQLLCPLDVANFFIHN